MKIEFIRTFLEIADCANFNRAADNLNVTRSTVSARIKVIEDSFGRKLFERNPDGVQLTTAGLQFRRYALNIQRQWQQAHQRISLPEQFDHTIRLGINLNLSYLGLEWIHWMRSNAAEIALHVETDFSQRLMRQLADGMLDLVVVYRPRQTSGFVVEELIGDELILVVTDQRLLSEGWVQDYVFIDWGDEFRIMFSDAFPEIEIPAVSVGLGTLGLDYMLQKGGSGYFPKRIVQSYIEQGKLFCVDDAPIAHRSFYVVYSANERGSETLLLALRGMREIVSR